MKTQYFLLFPLLAALLGITGCSGSAAPADKTPADKTATAKSTTTEPTAGLPADHPYRKELENFVAPSVCKLYGPGWSGDGILIIKDGKVVSFEAGTTSVDPQDPSKPVWGGQQAKDLVGKEVPPIPKDAEPYLKTSVGLDVGCM